MSGAVILSGGKLDGQSALAQDASIQQTVTLLTTLASVIAQTGATEGTALLQLGIRGSDGKIYKLNGIGTGDSGVALQVYLPETGGFGQGAPSAALHVALKDTVSGNLGSPLKNGALVLEPTGTPGSSTPSKGVLVGGSDGSSVFRAFGLDASGNVGLQASGTAGVAGPTVGVQIAGQDNGGLTRIANVTSNGSLATTDSSAVPESPLSINGVVFTLGQSGAPTGAMTVNQTTTPLLPDSTGVSSISGQVRGQLEVVNVGNVDVAVSPSTATVWPVFWLISPGGSLVTTYSGPVSAIQNGTVNGSAPAGGVSALLNVAEWL